MFFGFMAYYFDDGGIGGFAEVEPFFVFLPDGAILVSRGFIERCARQSLAAA